MTNPNKKNLDEKKMKKDNCNLVFFVLQRNWHIRERWSPQIDKEIGNDHNNCPNWHLLTPPHFVCSPLYSKFLTFQKTKSNNDSDLPNPLEVRLPDHFLESDFDYSRSMFS